jgi:hypothetical protein
MRIIHGKYIKLVIAIFSIVLSYYIAIILHEWGHGTIAWLYGYKGSPFDVEYGGWLLLRVDENVPYNQILAADHGVAAALIGIAGLTVSVILFVLSLKVLSKIKCNFLTYSFFYWFAVLNMVPIFQYLTIQTFSVQGDVGRFTHGLGISPWWVFIPGASFVWFSLYRFYGIFIPKAYFILSINALLMRRIFLLASLCIMFLLIYTHGYNPLSDKGMPLIGKFLAGFSILLVPAIFFLCNPSNDWVKQKIQENNNLEG